MNFMSYKNLKYSFFILLALIATSSFASAKADEVLAPITAINEDVEPYEHVNTSQNIEIEIAKGNYKQALSYLESAEATPDNLRLKAKVYAKLNMFKEAEQTALAYSNISTSDYLSSIVLGDAYLAYGDFIYDDLVKKKYLRKAFVVFNYAHEKYPKRPEAVVGLSKVFYARGKFPKSFDYMLEAKELDGEDYNTLNWIADFFMMRKNYEKAVEYYRRTAYYSPYPNYQVYFNLGVLYEKLADMRNARWAYAKAHSIYPSKEVKEKIDSLDKF